MLPLILSSVLFGGIMASIVSSDEVIMALLLSGPGQKTLPRQIWLGENESVSPVIMATATRVTVISAALMTLERTLFGRVSAVSARDHGYPKDRA